MSMPIGFKHSKETKEKMSASKIGIKRSPEARRSISMCKKGEKNPSWKGGKIIASTGYVIVYSPDHPSADSKGYVREHRLVMEAHLGRTLSPIEVVHHINGIKTDNRIENLMLFSSDSEHLRNRRTNEGDKGK